jgi:hypothetical protein
MARIFFTSAEHQQRFLATIQHLGKVYAGKLDQWYAAALYILTADTGTWEAVQRYISRRGIRFDLIIEKLHFSSGELVLMQLAGNLFGQDIHVDPIELMRLDPSNFKVALSALLLRRDAFRLIDFEEKPSLPLSAKENASS